jgi:hypothetical protein
MSDKDDPPGVIVIQRVGKRMSLSKQAEKDQVLASERLRRNGASLAMVRQRLASYSPSLQKKELLVVAQRMPGLVLDRLAKRSRDCLICWFCENWGAIEPHLPGLRTLQPRVSDADSRNSCVCARIHPEAAGEAADDFEEGAFGFGAFESPFEIEGGFEFYDVLQ